MRVSGYILALVLFTAGFGVAAPQQSATNEQQLASVRGVVVDSVTGDRLRKAFVRLHPASGGVRPATTDDQGRFVFENLPPGTYKMEAEHAGYLTSLFDSASGAAVELRLSAGETADVNLKLTPQAAISGRVVDSDGDAWVHASLEVYRSVFKQGRRQLEFRQSGDWLDDKAGFRVSALLPGTYYIKAVPSVEWERDNRLPTEERLQPTWYPNSFEIEGSTPIILSPGQELAGIEIRLRKGASYRIRGTVSGLEDVPSASGGASQPYRRIWASALGPAGDGYGGNLRPDGSFEIQGVPSDEYELSFSLGMPPIVLGRSKVQVNGRDVDGVSIEVMRTHAIHGTIRFEDRDTGRISGLNVAYVELESRNMGQSARTRDDGSFDFPRILSGHRYRVFVPATYSGEYYLKLAHYESQDSPAGIISFTDRDGPLELVLSTRGARVAVNMKEGDAVGVASAGRVVLIPDTDSPEEREFGTRPAVQDQNGGFMMGNIAPGAYRLFAFENVPDGAWVDVEFWNEIRSKGTELHISEGESKTADARLVLKSEIAGLLSRLGME